jgi:arylsulfatase A-like enzyme
MSRPALREVRDIGMVAVWFAMIAAMLELLVRGSRMFLFGSIVRMSRDVIWLAPIGQLMIFVPLTMAVLLVLSAFPARMRFPLATATFAFVTAMGVLLTLRIVHPAAVLILAAGIAVQLARLTSRTSAPLLGVVRRTLPLAVLLLVTAGAAVSIGRVVSERIAIAALLPARQSSPNVILLIWDTVRARSLSLYGNSRRTTPNLARLAREGVVFDRAIAPAPWTLPSHASIFTGHPPHLLSTTWTNPLDDRQATLAEVFRDAGYLTGGFAANVLYAGWESGLDRGFVHYEDYPFQLGNIMLSTTVGRSIVKGRGGWEAGPVPAILGYRQFMGRRLGESIDEEFLEWIDERADRPFFAFLNYFDAHLPYVPPAPFDTMYTPARPHSTMLERTREVLEGHTFWSALSMEELEAEVAAYEASIAYLDHRLGVLVNELQRRGVLDNTLIVITADHGEEFFEMGDHEHGTNVYMPQLHVPLVVLYPGHVPAGHHVSEPVSLQQLAATISDLTDVPGGGVLPGSSLSAWWDTGATAGPHSREAAFAELVPGLTPDEWIRSLFAGRLHYIRDSKGKVELYDYVADSTESRNLADDPAHANERRQLDAAMQTLLICKSGACCCRVPVAEEQPDRP